MRLFLALDDFPVGVHLADAADLHLAEHVRVPAAHLLADRPGGVLDVERAAFFGELAVEDDLEQEVAQFVAHLAVVAGVHRIKEFRAFLGKVFLQRGVRLLAVPRTAVRRPQPGKDFH